MNFDLLYPTFALVIWTIAIALSMLVVRIRGVQAKRVHPGYFKTMDSRNREIPASVVKFSRNYANLFEMPTLFYAIMAISISMRIESSTLVSLAWVYVALRAIHSMIHVTFNNVIARLMAFVASNVVLVCIWVVVLTMDR